MKIFLIAGAALILAASLAITGAIRRDYGTNVVVNQHSVRMLIKGQGGPAVVFESAGIAPIEAWSRVQPEVAKFTQAVAYDHAGFWGSEPGPVPRDADRIADELHTALHAAGIKPPYILVGHSMGGPFVRVFAHSFSNEVAALILLDPAQEEAFDWMKIHTPELNQISEEDRLQQNEWGCSDQIMAEARAAWPLPDVPIVLITAMKAEKDEPENMPEIRKEWLQAHEHWISKMPNATHIVTENSGHAIILEEPQLVVDTIRRVYDKVRDQNAGRPAK
jgi:pimeloyl-ACP methyl ester carboxylesterase